MSHDLTYDPRSYRPRGLDIGAGLLLYVVLLLGAGGLL